MPRRRFQYQWLFIIALCHSQLAQGDDASSNDNVPQHASVPASAAWEAAHVVKDGGVIVLPGLPEGSADVGQGGSWARSLHASGITTTGWDSSIATGKALQSILSPPLAVTTTAVHGVQGLAATSMSPAPTTPAAEAQRLHDNTPYFFTDGLLACVPVHRDIYGDRLCHHSHLPLFDTTHFPIACCSHSCAHGNFFCTAEREGLRPRLDEEKERKGAKMKRRKAGRREAGKSKKGTGRAEPKEDFEKEGLETEEGEEEGEEEEEIDTVELAMACMLLGGVAFVMMLFYLVNNHDPDIRQYSWYIISTTISIFTSVLMFMGIDGILEHTVDIIAESAKVTIPHILRLAIYYLQCIIWYLLLQLTIMKIAFLEESEAEHIMTASNLVEIDGSPVPVNTKLFEEKKRLMMKCWAVLLAHTTGFSAINAGGRLQHSFFFPSSPACTLVAVLLQYAFLMLIFAAGDAVREQHQSTHSQLWDEQTEEAENDVFCLTLSFLFIQVVRFAFVGTLPDAMGLLPLDTVYRAGYLIGLTLSAFACMVASAMLSTMKNLCNPAAGGMMMRYTLLLQGTLADAFAWGIFYAAKAGMATCTKAMLPQQFDLDDGSVAMRVMLACSLSALALALIFMLDTIEDLEATGENADKVIRSIMSAISILVGFSWEQAFERGGEVIAELTAKHGKWFPVITKFLLGSLLALGIIPAWRNYILKRTIEGVLNKEERGQRRSMRHDRKSTSFNGSAIYANFRNSGNHMMSQVMVNSREHDSAGKGTYSPVATEDQEGVFK